MFSKACEYGIKAAIFIATKSEQKVRVSIVEIAKEVDSPVSFTSKILQKLVKCELIDSLKGPTGGFEIKKVNAQKIKISDIVNAIDGDSIYKDCGLGFQKCNDKEPCSLHFKFKIVREELRAMLENTSLLELSNDIKKGTTLLKQK